MKQWQSLRTILLAVTFSSVLLVLGKSVLYPTSVDRRIPTFDLPDKIPLRGWQFVGSYPLTTQSAQSPGLVTSVDENSIAARHYRYVQNGVQLEIEMRHFANSYIDVPSIIKESSLTSKNPTIVLRELAGVGAYAVFSQQGRTHLSTCIRLLGLTTVSDRQFHQNQNSVEVLSDRVLPWFLGQASLRDMRCLWANLSISANASPETDEEILRSAWAAWQPWWRQNFPSVEGR